VVITAVAILLGVGWHYRGQVDATTSDWILRFDAKLNEWKADEEPAAIAPAVPAIPTPANPLSLPTEAKVIHLGRRPELDVPATRVTEWWVDHPRLGRVSVQVPVGTTPRGALTLALAERGYQVIR
jgi:hypothetical protein